MVKLEQTVLFEKVYGALTSGALGDVMGAPVEGWEHEKIQQEHGWVSFFLPKNGVIGEWTDDTYLKNMICRHYISKREHFTAADMVEVWAKIDLDKVGLAERYTHMCAARTGMDPFFAGKGNLVICGSAMSIAPVGLINACNPMAAYREATSVAAINTHSYGLEGTAVLAAGIAEAMKPYADRDSVFAAAILAAHDGTKKALQEVYDEVRRHRQLRDAILPVRDITTRWDGRLVGSNPGIESRDRCLEEVAVAFAMCYLADGDVMNAILGSVNFGRDNDSIAGMAGALSGALYGGAGLDCELVSLMEKANDHDSHRLALDMCEVIVDIHSKDRALLNEASALWEEPSRQTVRANGQPT